MPMSSMGVLCDQYFGAYNTINSQELPKLYTSLTEIDPSDVKN